MLILPQEQFTPLLFDLNIVSHIFTFYSSEKKDFSVPHSPGTQNLKPIFIIISFQKLCTVKYKVQAFAVDRSK